jgi:hypothetical protein
MHRDRRKERRFRVNVAIAVADESRHLLREVAAACCALGFEHAATLGDIGVLTGTAFIDELPSLRSVPGVIAVEIERAPRTQTLPQPRARNYGVEPDLKARANTVAPRAAPSGSTRNR